MTRARTFKRRPKPMAIRVMTHVAGILVALLFLAPIVWAVLATFKSKAESGRPPLPPWPTEGVSLANYRALDDFGAGLLHYTGNSVFVSVATALITVVVSVLAGYGFSRFRFPWKSSLFVIVLATMMVPFQSIVTPLFLILAWLGLQNTLGGLVLNCRFPCS